MRARTPRSVRHVCATACGLVVCVLVFGTTSIVAIFDWVASAPHEMQTGVPCERDCTMLTVEGGPIGVDGVYVQAPAPKGVAARFLRTDGRYVLEHLRKRWSLYRYMGEEVAYRHDEDACVDREGASRKSWIGDSRPGRSGRVERWSGRLVLFGSISTHSWEARPYMRAGCLSYAGTMHRLHGAPPPPPPCRATCERLRLTGFAAADDEGEVCPASARCLPVHAPRRMLTCVTCVACALAWRAHWHAGGRPGRRV